MEPEAAAPYHSAPYEPNLRVGYVLGKSWDLFKANMGIVLGATAIYLVVAAIFSGTSNYLPTRLGLIGWVISGPMTVGLYSVLLRSIRNEGATLDNLLDGFRLFGRSFGVYLLESIAILVGLILLVVPGIIVMVGLLPALFLVYDDRLSVVETLQRSWEMTRGYKWQIFVLTVIIFLIILAGLLFFLIGIFFTAAFGILAGAVVYEELALGEVLEPQVS